MTSVTVTIAGGDRDCSSAVGTCLEAVGLLPPETYVWTGNERGLLRTAGYVQVGLADPRRGDVLWREGHTEMYLGNGMQGGARIDEVGGVHGPKVGDQTGNEIGRGPYDPTYWRWESAWRYAGTRTLSGIPMDEATAQVMDHLIDHAAHGYSQDHRDGDGTVERVTIVWDGAGPEPEPALVVDGWLGMRSVMEWQRQLGTTVDGVVSGQWRGLRDWYPNLTAVEWGGTGSVMVAAIQRRVGATRDGILGPATIRGIQAYVGTTEDGVLGPNTAKAVQRSLNAGRWS